MSGVTIINPDGSTGVSDWVIFIDAENKLVAIGPDSAKEALSLVIGTDIQAWDAELDTIAGLAETNGNVMFVAGGAWTSDATPAIDCSDCTNVPAGDVSLSDLTTYTERAAFTGATGFPLDSEVTGSFRAVGAPDTTSGVSIIDGTVTTADVSTTVKGTGVAFFIDGAGSALTTGTSIFYIWPVNYAVTGFNVMTDSEANIVSLAIVTAFQVRPAVISGSTNFVFDNGGVSTFTGLSFDDSWASSSTSFKRGDVMYIEVLGDTAAVAQKVIVSFDGNKTE